MKQMDYRFVHQYLSPIFKSDLFSLNFSGFNHLATVELILSLCSSKRSPVKSLVLAGIWLLISNNSKKIPTKLIKPFTSLLSIGDRTAIFLFAILQQTGIKPYKRNLERAFNCFKVSYLQGVKEAANYLASCYFHGRGTKRNFQEAYNLYQEAEKTAEVNRNLGIICFNLKIKKNGFEYFLLGSQKNDAVSDFYLGLLYENGLRIQKDEKMALKYYLKSELEGSSLGFYSLGMMFYEGNITDKDVNRAYHCFCNSLSYDASLFMASKLLRQEIVFDKENESRIHRLAYKKGDMEAGIALGKDLLRRKDSKSKQAGLKLLCKLARKFPDLYNYIFTTLTSQKKLRQANYYLRLGIAAHSLDCLLLGARINHTKKYAIQEMEYVIQSQEKGCRELIESLTTLKEVKKEVQVFKRGHPEILSLSS
jgi:TPR repeat protein